MTIRQVPPPLSKEVVATVRHHHERAAFPVKTALSVLGLPRSTFFDWARLEDGGKAPRPPATTPKAHHITPDERAAVIAYARQHRELGHKRLAYAMADAGIAAETPPALGDFCSRSKNNMPLR